MRASDLSKKELAAILDFIEAARNCRGEAALKGLLLKARELLSADRAVCGTGRLRGGRVTDILTIVNSGWPQEWLTLYKSLRLYSDDPLVRYHARFSPSELWSEIFKRYEDAPARHIIRLADDFGLRHGVSSGIYSPESSVLSVFAFAGCKDSYNARHKKIADIIMLHLNRVLAREMSAPEKESFKKPFACNINLS